MLVYSKTNAAFAGYNQRYADNPELFKVSTTHLNFADNVMALVAGRPDLAVLEVGCGQGYLLSHLRERQPARYFGVDGSDVAIAQAEERDPECRWIADSLLDFLDEHDARLGAQSYDVIVDRTGTTFIREEAQARLVQGRLRSLLRPGGALLYMASRSFYDEKCVPRLYADWSSDWIGLLRRQIPYVIDASDAGSYLLAFVNR